MSTSYAQDNWTPELGPPKRNIDPLFLAAGARKSTVSIAKSAVFDAVLPEKSFAIPSNPYGYGVTEAMPVYARQQSLINTTQTQTGFVPTPKEKETAVNPASVMFGADLSQADDLQPLNYLDGMAEATTADRIIQVGNAAVQSEGVSNVQ